MLTVPTLFSTNSQAAPVISNEEDWDIIFLQFGFILFPWGNTGYVTDNVPGTTLLGDGHPPMHVDPARLHDINNKRIYNSNPPVGRLRVEFNCKVEYMIRAGSWQPGLMQANFHCKLYTEGQWTDPTVIQPNTATFSLTVPLGQTRQGFLIDRVLNPSHDTWYIVETWCDFQWDNNDDGVINGQDNGFTWAWNQQTYSNYWIKIQ
jgi:hypothetical protein